MNKGIGGHQSANMKSDEWLTPPELIKSLGVFDLDPCSPINRPWDTATSHYTKLNNGLLMPRYGKVWMNPPYGSIMALWLEKMAEHRNGVALTFARTETQMFHRHVFPHADSILFLEGRITFYDVNGRKAAANGGAPSVLIGYGEQNVDAIEDSGIKGRHIPLNCAPVIVVGVDHTWKSIISVAIMRRDGETTIQEIYKIVEQIAPGKVTGNEHYKEKIRQQLQYHYHRVRKGVYRKREATA